MTNDVLRDAATAVVVNDSEDQLQVLLLRRHQQLKVGGGHWVFPGGTVDPEDREAGDGEYAARAAAIRETAEEASLSLPSEDMIFYSHWTTPPFTKRRFATWFFIVDTATRDVVVDGQEMDDYMWLSPAEAISRHRSGELAMMPPTLATLSELSLCRSYPEVLQFSAGRSVPHYHPRITDHQGKVCMLYPGDAGYDSADPSAEGPRNRSYMVAEGRWHYLSDWVDSELV